MSESPLASPPAVHRRHVQAAEMAAREMGGLSLADALLLCELLADVDPSRYERAALRWLQRFIVEGVLAMRLYALVEAGDPKAIDVYFQRAGRAARA